MTHSCACACVTKRERKTVHACKCVRVFVCQPLYICRRFQRPLTLLLSDLRFKAMLTLKAFLYVYQFVFVFRSCHFMQGIWRSFTKNCHPRLLFQRQIGATTKLSRDSVVLYPCTTRLKNSPSTLNVMNSMNCTPANQLYCCMINDRH